MSDFRLRVFSSVAKNLSFTKASQELFISQPAITKHIQELETMYQTRLFERMGNKILLTDAGRLLLEHCEKILEDYGRLEYEMNLLRNVSIPVSCAWEPVLQLPNMCFPLCWPASSRSFRKCLYHFSAGTPLRWKRHCRNIV